MNRRKMKKLQKQFNNNCLNARQSCLYCTNWECGCANGNPNVYSGDRSDYLCGCKEEQGACSFLAKHLQKEGYSLSGWKLTEIPATHCYVFFNNKKRKDITIIYDKEKSYYIICSTDLLWKYSDHCNMYEHNTVTEALKSPWQDTDYWLGCAICKNKKKRKHTLKRLRSKQPY